MQFPLDVDHWRKQFPALARELHGRPAVFFDGPAGSQVPARVIDAIGQYLLHTNANQGGDFATSRESDAILAEAHCAAADLLGADDPECVVFGPNMTTLTFALSRAMARTWRAGDEIVVTDLDHDANITPWVLAAREAGATVQHVRIHTDDCTLDVDDLNAKLSARTRLVAVGCASNGVGTINPVGEIVRLSHQAGAQVFLDAVHYAPHAAIDVTGWDCDFLTCSAYKFFGPHVGMLWGRRELLEDLPVYKVRPAPSSLPGRWMTGTQNHEGIAGTLGAINYLADVGRTCSGGMYGDDRASAAAGISGTAPTDRRAALLAALGAIGSYERQLCGRLLQRLSELPEVNVWGITDPARLHQRVPTVAFTHAHHTPQEVSRHLARSGIFVWAGNHYAVRLCEVLGLQGGSVRVGLLHYNTADEVDRLAGALAELGA